MSESAAKTRSRYTISRKEEEERARKEWEEWFKWKDGGCLYQTLHNVFSAFANRKCLGTRAQNADGTWGDYEWIHYNDLWTLAQLFGSGLTTAMSDMESDTTLANTRVATDKLFVAVCAINRTEWIVTDIASVLYDYVVVPMHTTLSTQVMTYILDHAQCSVLVVSRSSLAKVLGAARGNTHLRLIVCLDSIADPSDEEYPLMVELMRTSAVQIVSYSELLHSGRLHYKPHVVQKDPASLYTILYTSGSTGVPKGAVMTNKRWNDFVCAPYLMPDPVVQLSFAPLAHVAERQSVWLTLVFGGQIGFFHGDVSDIFVDFHALNPTLVSATPRFYNQIHSEYLSALNKALGAQPAADRAALEKSLLTQFGGVLGDKLQFLVTGSAPTSPAVKDFLRRCFPCPLYDGYGTTEAGGISTDDRISPNVDVRLEDVPELGYLSSDTPYARGEICVKTKTMIPGYYRNDQATRDAFTADGYFRTGDIGQREADNVVRIIDRKKNVFKIANGEFIAPEQLENMYLESAFIDQLLVYGETDRNCLLAVVIPNAAYCASWQEQHTADVMLDSVILRDMARIAREKGAPAYEVPWQLVLDDVPFTPENGLMTYSNKLSRRSIEARYQARFTALYEQLDQRTTSSDVAAAVSDILGSTTGIAEGGGDSLSAVRLQAMFKSKFGVDVELKQLFETNSEADFVALARGKALRGARLPTDDLRDLQPIDHSATCALTLQLRCDSTRFGYVRAPSSIASLLIGRCGSEEVFVVGSCAELGSWNPQRGVQLHTSADAFPCWTTTLAVPRATDLCIRFVIRAPDGATRHEPLDEHRGVPSLSNVAAATLDCGSFGCAAALQLGGVRRVEKAQESTSTCLLITGATGFVGAFVVAALAARAKNISDCQLICLVRAASDDAAQERLKSAFASRLLSWPDHGIRAVAGDLERDHFGLSPAAYRQLAQQTTAVFHCAAAVNWIRPYAALRESNVVGTARVLEFCTQERRKAIHFVSTNGVSGGHTEGDLLPARLAVASSGYNASKWVAEQLVTSFAARAQLDCVVYRPGMVGAHASTGVCNPADYIARYVRGALALRCYVADADDACIEMIPVDYLADSVARLSLHLLAQQRSQNARQQHCFPFSNAEVGLRGVRLRSAARQNSPSYTRVGEACARAAQDHGATVEPLEYTAWRSQLLLAGGENALAPLLPFFPEAGLQMRWRPTPCEHTQRMLREIGGRERPRVTDAMLDAMCKQLWQ